MRRISVLLLLLTLLFGCSAPLNKQASRHIEDGQLSYDISLVMENASISEIVLDNYYDSNKNEEAAQQIIMDIIGTQTVNVAPIEGSETISLSIINSVKLLLQDMGIDDSLFIDQKVDETIDVKQQYDSIVIGSGVAGLSAAIRLAENGNDVLILEKMPYAGGATYLSGGEIAVPMLDTSSDDPEYAFLMDMYNGSNQTADFEKLEKIAYNIDEVFLWLKNDVGVEFHEEPYLVNEHSVARVNLPVERGKGLVDKLVERCEQVGVDIRYNNEAISLVEGEDGIIGVNTLDNNEDNRQYIANDKVIIATGGFAYNKQLLIENNTQWTNLENLNSTVPSGSTGDGILMGMEVGAATVDMDNIQIFPFTNPATGVNHYLENVRTNLGAIFVNKQGERFVEEQSNRIVLSQKILEQTDQMVYQVFNQEIYDATLSFSYAKETYDTALEQGVLFSCDTLEACCSEVGIDKNLIDTYTVDGPYYVLVGKPSIHYTMGGLVTNIDSQVIDTNGEVINGLYAIGEVVGGTFGENRIGASSIDDALVNGYMIE